MGHSVYSMHEDRSIDCTEDEFMGFSVTSERSYQIHVLMFSPGFDERAISAPGASKEINVSCKPTPHAFLENSDSSPTLKKLSRGARELGTALENFPGRARRARARACT